MKINEMPLMVRKMMSEAEENYVEGNLLVALKEA